jgi:hypothetical protein
LKKGQVNLGASKKSSAGFPASGRDHTLEAVVRKLGVNRQQSLAREELGNRPEYGGAAVWPLAARTQQATVGFFNAKAPDTGCNARFPAIKVNWLTHARAWVLFSQPRKV